MTDVRCLHYLLVSGSRSPRESDKTTTAAAAAAAATRRRQRLRHLSRDRSSQSRNHVLHFSSNDWASTDNLDR